MILGGTDKKVLVSAYNANFNSGLTWGRQDRKTCLECLHHHQRCYIKFATSLAGEWLILHKHTDVIPKPQPDNDVCVRLFWFTDVISGSCRF